MGGVWASGRACRSGAEPALRDCSAPALRPRNRRLGQSVKGAANQAMRLFGTPAKPCAPDVLRASRHRRGRTRRGCVGGSALRQRGIGLSVASATSGRRARPRTSPAAARCRTPGRRWCAARPGHSSASSANWIGPLQRDAGRTCRRSPRSRLGPHQRRRPIQRRAFVHRREDALAHAARAEPGVQVDPRSGGDAAPRARRSTRRNTPLLQVGPKPPKYMPSARCPYWPCDTAACQPRAPSLSSRNFASACVTVGRRGARETGSSNGRESVRRPRGCAGSGWLKSMKLRFRSTFSCDTRRPNEKPCGLTACTCSTATGPPARVRPGPPCSRPVWIAEPQ